MRLEAEALGFERDRAAASERVEDRRRVAARRLEDLACASASSTRSRVFSQTTSRSMIPCRRSLGALGLLGREAVGMRRRVVDELSE